MIPDIPPKWVLRAASNALDKTDNYDDYYDVLCGYYQIDFVSATFNKEECLKLGKNTVAFYRRSAKEKRIYSKTKTLDRITALHEFFHHLAHEKDLVLADDATERLADAYAEACLNAV